MATTNSNDIIDIIIDLIKLNIPKDRYKTIWYGDPLNIPNRSFPSLTVFGQNVETSLGRTQCDKETQTIVIKQLIDKRQILKDNHQEVFGLRLLRKWLFGKDSNGQYNTDTLYYLLRNKFSLTDSDGDARIEFQDGFNTEFQIGIEPTITTYESTTSFTVTRSINMNSRT